MSNEIKLGKVAGLDLSAMPSAPVSFIALWVVLSVIGIGLIGAPAVKGIIAALGATVLHWLGETWHQLGHILAARQTGHPMTGIRYWGFLSASVYPLDEPELPAATHIRRALGGPTASLVLSIVAGLIAIPAYARGGTWWYVALFFFLDNFLVFTLGAFLPLGFTDGSTLLKWRNKT